MIRELKHILPRGMLIRCIARMPWHDMCRRRSWIIDLAKERVPRQPPGFQKMREQGHGQILAQTRVVPDKKIPPGTKAPLTQGGDRAQQPELIRAHQGGCRFRQVEHVGIRSLIPIVNLL